MTALRRVRLLGRLHGRSVFCLDATMFTTIGDRGNGKPKGSTADRATICHGRPVLGASGTPDFVDFPIPISTRLVSIDRFEHPHRIFALAKPTGLGIKTTGLHPVRDIVGLLVRAHRSVDGRMISVSARHFRPRPAPAFEIVFQPQKNTRSRPRMRQTMTAAL
jgi:hypothetical protein